MAKTKKVITQDGEELNVLVKRPWYKLKRTWIGVFIMMIIIGNLGEAEEGVSPTGDVPQVETVEADIERDESPTEIVEEVEEEVSREFDNALKSARNYLSFMAFSPEGLADQLDYEGYPADAIEWAMEQINNETDWYEQAVRSAESYLSTMDFSKSGLIDQLEYEGFTTEQAEYAVDTVY